MQTLGTEWGRDMISGDLWMRAMETNLEYLSEKRGDGWCCVIDDIRFPNEMLMVERMGGMLCTVRRRLYEAGDDTHESEIHYTRVMEIAKHPERVFQLNNEGTIESLQSSINAMLNYWSPAPMD